MNSDNKILIVADSAWELLMSIHIKLSLYRNCFVTLIMTDRSQGMYEVYKKIKNLNVIDEVIFVEANQFPGFQKTRLLPNVISSKLYDMICEKRAASYLNKPSQYKYFITSEIDYFSRYMYLAVKKTAEPLFLGEGIFTFGGFVENIENNKLQSNARLLRDANTILYYGPKLKELPFRRQIQIPSVNQNRNELVSILNNIFGYIPHKKVYSNKIIFFEESYSNDGGSDNALDFLQTLVRKYGKEKIVVKRHPRDKENRFAKMELESIEPFNIPWELFTLNGDCTECILLAANSASVYLSKLWDLCNEPIECVMLNHLLDYEYVGGSCMDVYMQFLDEVYMNEKYMVPNTEEEMFVFIDRIIGEWKNTGK